MSCKSRLAITLDTWLQCLDYFVASYGSVVPVSGRDPSKFQHQGFGMLLMEEAERIALQEHGSHKISVISGTL